MAPRAYGFVVTTTNVGQLRKIAGQQQELHEIIGKPYDLDEVVRAVMKHLRQSAGGQQARKAN